VRRAKIVCTLGPSSESSDVILKLLEQGMDVARLNFSHGTHEDHARAIERRSAPVRSRPGAPGFRSSPATRSSSPPRRRSSATRG
jgi:pyruvate kinase